MVDGLRRRMAISRCFPAFSRCLAIVGVIAGWALAASPLPLAAQETTDKEAQGERRWKPLRALDESAAAAAGIRKLSGKRLVLYTDVRMAAEVESLPEVFEQAVPQWCEYFKLDASRSAGWLVRGFLMADQEKFRKTGLLPPKLPEFVHGFTAGREVWCNDQGSDYFRRHLLLHEGTHSFMYTILGDVGPPWYAEGMADLFGTHRWADGRLTLNVFPKRTEDVPGWGRVRMLQTEYAARRAKTLEAIFRYPLNTRMSNETYAWSWAAAAFLDHHPRYRERFRQLPRWVAAESFPEQFSRLIGDEARELAEAWQVFVCDLEYGYDFTRTVLDFSPGRPIAGTSRVTVASDRGWQNSGLRLEAGATYRLRAAGRFQVAKEPKPWWCEPNGVSIRYYHGRPLGILLAAVRPDLPVKGRSPLVAPEPIGLSGTLAPEHTGTLFLRINDSAAELDDNAGTLLVQIEPVEGEAKER